METITILLSDSLKDCLKNIYDAHSSQIAKDLLTADNYINMHNKLACGWSLTEEEKKEICPILQEKINELVTDEVRALSIRRDVFEISFTPKGKELKYNGSGNWSRENRQTGKPGRIIKKLLTYDYKERDIEIFNNLLKAEIMDFGEWKLVEGSDICYWYNSDNYFKIAGTLGNSCMRYDECECYFSVYEDNAKMLVCIKNNKLLGRAIVWEIDGKTYMDRVYVCLDYLEEQFIQYAQDKGWYIRTNQALLSDSCDQEWYGPDSKYTEIEVPRLVIQLPRNYDRFPYMDSFRHFNPEKSTISTICRLGNIKLSNTDGYWEENLSTCECIECGNVETYYEDDDPPYYWSEYHDDYLCPDCALWCDYLETYVSRRISLATVNLNSGATCDIPLEVINDNLLTTNQSVVFREDFFVKIDEEYYQADLAVWDEDLQKFRLNERD